MNNLLTEHDLDNLSVETIVMLIQNSSKGIINCSKVQVELFWEVLYKKTENSIYDTFHKEVIFDEWKRNESIKEEIITILRTGWVKAVYKYDITKDKTKKYFVAFAQYLMHQEYVNCYGKRHTKEKNGVSIKEVFINSVVVYKGDIKDSSRKELIEAIEVDKNGNKDYDNIEVSDMLKQKMDILKKYYPMSYEMIIKYVFEEMSQQEIADEYNIKQSCVSRHIKKGKNFLREIISEDELYA